MNGGHESFYNAETALDNLDQDNPTKEDRAWVFPRCHWGSTTYTMENRDSGMGSPVATDL